jgi:hypothetical protein
LRALFEKGHSPASALSSLKMDLQTEYGPDYVLKAGDRATCPDLQFCHRYVMIIYKTRLNIDGSGSSLPINKVISCTVK